MSKIIQNLAQRWRRRMPIPARKMLGGSMKMRKISVKVSLPVA